MPWNSSTAADTDEFSPQPPPAPQTGPAEDSSSCASFVEGVPVGLACLHCGQPAARAQALRLAEIMAESCRRNLAATVLIDGSFSDDRDQIGEVVRIAASRGATLHLFLYLSNGPWQRAYPNEPALGIGTNMPPEEFREKILSDPALQSAYQERVRWALPLVSYALSQGSRVYLIPMLEDNLSGPAARKMEELTLAMLPSSLPVSLGRNPCPGCYAGNDASIPAGLFEDQHVHSPQEGVHAESGLVTNDGETVVFPHERQDLRGISVPELGVIIRDAASRNNAYVIWRSDYQGLQHGMSVPPDSREYAMPTEADTAVLKELLTRSY